MIGLFDSGIGGLTVLKSLQSILPDQSYIYLGDTARLPYGTKSADTIRRYTQQNIAFLEKQGVQLIISACHSASSSILQFKIQGPVPLYNVIEPACAEAMRLSRGKKIGLLATQATVDAGQYAQLIQPPFELHSHAAPLLVPLVECGWTEDPVTDQVIGRYTDELLKKDVDVIILGCTHFPLLKESLQKIVGPNVKLVDPGDTLAKQIAQHVKPPRESSLRVFLTDSSPHFVRTAQNILKTGPVEVEQVDL